jgi:hypothetical protein
MEIANVWHKKLLTATGVALGRGQVFGGLVVQVAGTTTTFACYDDAAAATAANLIVPTTATSTSNVAGVYISPLGGAVGTLTSPPNGGAGIVLENGLWVVIGGTGTPSVWVLFR